MVHLAEGSNPLKILHIKPQNLEDLYERLDGFSDVCILRMPPCPPSRFAQPLNEIEKLTSKIALKLNSDAVLILIGDVVDLVHVCASMPQILKYQLWIAIKRESKIEQDHYALPSYHFGAVVFTKYHDSLRHVKTRIKYSYCPVCDKTTKDYGGKKHTYHEYGTIMSDVWRDISCSLDGNLDILYKRFADLFGIDEYEQLIVADLRELLSDRSHVKISASHDVIDNPQALIGFENTLYTGDCIKQLKKIPSNSIDFAFADPPYNLKKKYDGYSDDLLITEYFNWCDSWISELARVLRPGRTLALLNIPLWAVRHFIHMETKLQFQNWIAWDALSFPVRQIMPAHYAIVCFTKGKPRELPGILALRDPSALSTQDPFDSLKPLAEGFCLRASCVRKRNKLRIDDRAPLTDLWWDIHRLKHNSRRVDHPCQLPPKLMYRLISIFTKPSEVVLDCFNGAGTTTLAAQQLGRKFIGIEVSKEYNEMARARHDEITNGLDPFRKCEKELTAKNSPVPRMPKQKYRVPKKTLQLDVKRITDIIGHIPSREEVIEHSEYPIDYFDKYFASWGEVCAAARTTGMTEDRNDEKTRKKYQQTKL